MAMVQQQAQQEVLRAEAERDRADAARAQVDTVLADLAAERDRNAELVDQLQQPTPAEVSYWPWAISD